MDTPDFEHGRVYFKQFGAERVNLSTNTERLEGIVLEVYRYTYIAWIQWITSKA